MFATKAEIEKDARLCAECGDESDCTYPIGTAAHAIWMKAYREQCRIEAENERDSYAMALEDGRT